MKDKLKLCHFVFSWIRIENVALHFRSVKSPLPQLPDLEDNRVIR